MLSEHSRPFRQESTSSHDRRPRCSNPWTERRNVHPSEVKDLPSRDGLVTDFCGKHLRARQTCLLAAFKDWGMLGRRWGSESPEPICHYGEDFLPIFCRKLEHRIKLLPRPPLTRSSIPCKNYANHEWRKPDVGHQHGISTPTRISADALGAVRIPPRRVLSYARRVCWSANR